MNYPEAVRFVLALPDWERGTGTRVAREGILLERPKALLNALGNPQTRYPSILIAGTKGKGSTAALLESILRAAGLKTGLYTSPHLHTLRERIRVDGALIAEDEFARGVETIAPLLGALVAEHRDYESYTTFEVMTVLALKHFADAQVDVAVVEVGLGGRLDATNVVDAELSLITPISYDHTAVLGETLTEIAREKAGIIKAGKPVLTAPQNLEALGVIEDTARARNAVLGVGDREWLWLGGHGDFMVAAAPQVGLWTGYWHYHDIHLPLLGPHQFVNAGLAVAAAELIRDSWGAQEAKFARVDSDAIHRGIAATKWAGRLEVLQAADGTKPLIVADGAHNGDSAEKLFDALKFHFEFEKLYLIFGVLGDKELDAIARPFALITQEAWTVQTKHPRSRTADNVALHLAALGIKAHAASDFSSALHAARERATARDLIVVTGSLSLVAEAQEAMGLDYCMPSIEISSQ